MQWQKIFWNQVVPTGTGVAFQVATMTNATDTPVYTGPSGTSSWFSTSGASLSFFTGRFCRFKVKLTPTATTTPSVSDVQLSYTKLASQTAALLPSQVRRFVYDNAGNLLKTNTYTDSASTAPALAIDTRDETSWVAADRVNNLNQIKRRDVGGVTYKYTYNLNGCFTQKKNAAGTDVWDYTWNQENRLTQAKHTVSGSVVKTITFSYDSMGRKLTRSDGTTTTKFTWDAWDCVSETDGTNTTTYMIPEGQLLSFKRGSNTYQVHCDALGSVRLVTDSTGAVVARFDFGSWGETLSSSFDIVPNGGMPYRFVGTLGVRWDADLGLNYMRNRWYDASIGAFLSRDPYEKLPAFVRLELFPDFSGKRQSNQATELPSINPEDIVEENLLRAERNKLLTSSGLPPVAQALYVYAVNNPGRNVDSTGLVPFEGRWPPFDPGLNLPGALFEIPAVRYRVCAEMARSCQTYCSWLLTIYRNLPIQVYVNCIGGFCVGLLNDCVEKHKWPKKCRPKNLDKYPPRITNSSN